MLYQRSRRDILFQQASEAEPWPFYSLEETQQSLIGTTASGSKVSSYGGATVTADTVTASIWVHTSLGFI